jgi:NADH-quinone oxidoreductase subunit M
MTESWLPTLCVCAPAAGAAALAVVPSRTPAAVCRAVMIAACGASLLIAAAIWRTAELSPAGPSLVQRVPWIPALHVDWFVGVDGLSLPLATLTAFVSTLAAVAGCTITENVRGYCALFCLLTASALGCFLALDLLLFFVFFEVMLLPMWFLIGFWGGPRREHAALKFLVYTLAGSALILAAMLAVRVSVSDPTAGFDLTRLPAEARGWSRGFQSAIFALLAVGFLVKLPAVPLHTWLPDAHVEAPTPASMVLAGVLLKVGGYGLMRVAYPLAPDVVADPAVMSAVMGVGTVGVVYGALVALAQTDLKRLVAYSSVSHMGYVLLGLGSLTPAGVSGAAFQMVAHGVSSAALFFIVGVVYARTGTRDLSRMGGLARGMPTHFALASVAFFASLGLPGLCGFPGEALALFGAFAVSPAWAVAAVLGVVLSAAYVLRAVQRVYFGPPREGMQPPAEASWWENAVLLAFAVPAVALGVAPAMVMDVFNVTLARLVIVAPTAPTLPFPPTAAGW